MNLSRERRLDGAWRENTGAPVWGGGPPSGPEEEDDCQEIIACRYRVKNHPTHNVNWTYLPRIGQTILNLTDDENIVELEKLSYSRTGEKCMLKWKMHLHDSTRTYENSDSLHMTRYWYDTGGRLVRKLSPDEGSTDYVYDLMGQLRFVKDENHRRNLTFQSERSHWTYYKYDALGRVIEQGEFLSPEPLDTVSARTRRDALYGPQSYPMSATIPTLINRYDNYGSGWQITLTGTDTSNSAGKGRLTRTRILDADAAEWSEEAYVYDEFGRTSAKYVYHPGLETVKKIEYEYDLTGKLLKLSYQKESSDRFFQWHEYDVLGRLTHVKTHTSDMEAQAVIEAIYTYDDNHGGKMSQVILGNSVQTLNYTYSIRDWLKSVNSNQFSQTLKYDDATVNPRYNGNIAQMAWNTAGNAGAYDFTYDGANRLTDAVTTSGPDFSEKLIHYDANGNIQTLKRGTASPINYTYNANIPNRLNSVSGGLSVTFTYDGNGNMTNDNTKGEFTYDYRNMPIKVVTNDTVIEYAYDAAGQRIRKTLKNNGSTLSGTIYVRGTNGNIVAEYRNGQIDHFNIYGNGLIGKLVPANRVVTINNQTLSGTQTIQASDSIIVTGESTIDGEITMEAGSQSGAIDTRYYYLSDHLGSIRVVLTESGNVDSWSDYYPFGKISRSSLSAYSPREKFNGKEFDDESGIYLYGMRYYNQDIARFISVDPISSKFPMLTPYQYASNDPIRNIDLDGLEGLPYTAVRQPGMGIVQAYKESWIGQTNWSTVGEGALKVATGALSAYASLRSLKGASRAEIQAAGGISNIPQPSAGKIGVKVGTGIVGEISIAAGVVDIVRGFEGKPSADLFQKTGEAFGLSKEQIDLVDLVLSGGQTADALKDIKSGDVIDFIDALVNTEQFGEGMLKNAQNLKKTLMGDGEKKKETDEIDEEKDK